MKRTDVLDRVDVENSSLSTVQLILSRKLGGYTWIIHENDADINEPSCPHCHAKENNKVKLDVYTGYIFDYSQGKRYIKKLKRKELKYLQTHSTFIEVLERYHRRYPNLVRLIHYKKRRKTWRMKVKHEGKYKIVRFC